MNRTNRQPALTDFNRSETITCDNTKSSMNQTMAASDRIHLAIRNEVKKAIEDLNKAKNEIISGILRDIETERLATKKKVRCQKRNNRVVYIADDIWPIFERFQENPDEPLKETLKKVAKAALKYHQENLQKTKDLR